MRSILIWALVVGGFAWAEADWQNFGKSFSKMPCSDGWSSCVRDGKSVGVGLITDAEGRFHPADMRVGFF